MNPATITSSQIGPGCVYSAQGNLVCNQMAGQDPMIPMKPYSCSVEQKEENYMNLPSMANLDKLFAKKEGFTIQERENYMNLPSMANLEKLFSKKEGFNRHEVTKQEIEGFKDKTPFNTALNMSSSLMPWP